MTRKLSVLLVVAAAAAFAAGCGARGLRTPVATSKVSLPKSYRFDPKAIAVKAGTPVTWTNEDNFTHTVKFEDGTDHKISPGQSVTIRFAKAGTFHYVCTLHPHDMQGEVIVK
jgi:plastocyanin